MLTYIHRILKVVENKFRNELLERFAIIFDTWSGGDTHYVAFFASYPASNDFSRFCPVFQTYMENIVAVVGDNCNTNRSISKGIGPTFVGCHSNRFNLAVRDIIAQNSNVVCRVQTLILKLSYHIPAAKLRGFTPLKAK